MQDQTRHIAANVAGADKKPPVYLSRRFLILQRSAESGFFYIKAK